MYNMSFITKYVQNESMYKIYIHVQTYIHISDNEGTISSFYWTVSVYQECY